MMLPRNSTQRLLSRLKHVMGRLPPPVGRSEEVDRALRAAQGLPEEQLAAEGRALLAAWRARPKHRRIPGVDHP